MPPSSQQRPASAAPPVRIEVRHGSAPPVGFDVAGDEFVIGSVPGCDLRIPGANLPPQVAVIQRTPESVLLRKVAPALPILLNGSPIAPNGVAELKHGDVISVGAVDLLVAIAFTIQQPAVVHAPVLEQRPAKDFRHEEWERKHRELEVRAHAIEEQARELEADRVLWYERRQEIERELAAAREQQDRTQPELAARLRARVESEVADEYRSRREELERMQLALREATLQLRERKQQFEDTLRNADPRLKDLEAREKALGDRERAAELQLAEARRLREHSESGRTVQDVRLQQREQDLARREVELAAREMAARDLAGAAEKDRGQYQSDLVRVDRLSAALDAKERSLELRAVEIDQRYEQFKNDTRDFEEQLGLFDHREDRLKDEEARLAARHEELDAREGRINSRLAEIETQQTTLVALRGKLELLRQDLLSQESKVSQSRSRTDEDVREAEERLRQALEERERIEAEKAEHAEGFRQYQERSALMGQAFERMRAMQEQIAAESGRLTAESAKHAEQAKALEERARELVEGQDRLDADRRAVRERENSLRQAEDAREALQDQLRLRSEELAARQAELEEKNRLLHEQAEELSTQLKSLEELRSEANSVRRLTDEEAAILADRDTRLREAEATITEQKRLLEEAQARFELEQAEAADRLDKAKAEIEELKDALSARTKELLGQMPDLEQRAQAALERTAQAREAMRSQLAELHAYALRSQEDLQSVRTQVQEELGQLREQEQALGRAKTEHRLAVSSFRQQLIEWQSRFAGMKQTLHQGETRLVRREKQIEETAQVLAERAEKIQQQEQEVTEKRTEVDRHLGDMQSWFRQKFREIAHTRWSKHRSQEAGDRSQGSEEAGILQMPERPLVTVTEQSVSGPYAGDAIIPLPDDLDPADRKLGELLRSLDIVDRETLHAMWDEARRQRRTLRQVLLSGGYLTLYQLALIESGNLSGLMLGRFRVIDRLLSTPREAIYRVFDPQLAGEAEAGTCLLRHLGEPEMLDAVRPDEYRQRFSAVRDLGHPNVAATREVLDINGRPAVVQEWLHGLPGGDWPAAVASPGVWHRLMMQAALGLHAAHTVGLTHGRLTPNSFLLTKPGVVKLIGVGEPPWLHASSGRDVTPEDDLQALGHVALGWMQGGRRKGVKLKPFPPGLIDVVRSLGVSPEDGGVPLAVYASTAALLEDLDRAAAEVPSDQGIWDKLLSYVGENGGDGIVLRQSA